MTRNDEIANAFFNTVDAILALRRFEGVLDAPLSDQGDDSPDYTIEDCLKDVKDFLEKLAKENNE